MIETLVLYSCTAAKSLQKRYHSMREKLQSSLVWLVSTRPEFAHFGAVAPHGWPRGDCSDNATEHLLAFIWMTDLKHGSISGKD